MDHPMQDDNVNGSNNQYTFYTQDQSYQFSYQHRIQDSIPYHNLAIIPQSHHYPHPQPPFPHAHLTQHTHSHSQHTPPPPSPELYDPLSPPLSDSNSSQDGALYHPSNSNSTPTTTSTSSPNSPSSSRPHSLVHRTPRYNPSPSPTSSSATGRRRRSHSQDSDDDDFAIVNSLSNNMGSAALIDNLAHSRKEATRRQRIEAEQRRRDELRDGYAKLKDALPLSNQKSSKVSLLERAVSHIMALEKENQELQARITFLEQESNRLRTLNEKISLHSEGTASPEPAVRRNTTTPDALNPSAPPPNPSASSSSIAHSLTPVRGQRPPSEHSSPSASEHGH